MFWLTWRQHRTQLVLCALLLAALSLVIIVDGLTLNAAFQSSGMASCLAAHTPADCAGDPSKAFFDDARASFGIWSELIFALPWLLPLLIGVFIGAPLIAREQEQRHHYLIWNQSITRSRWLAIKLALLTGCTLLFCTILALLTNWWSGPLGEVEGLWQVYGLRGITFPAFALCALMLGILIGTFVRKVVPAMLLTFLLLVILQITLKYTYPYFIPPASHLYPRSITSTNAAWGQPNDLVLYAGFADTAGHETGELSQYCGFHATLADKSYPSLANQCIQAHNLQWKIIYQSADHFWLLQGAEAAFLLLLTSVMAILTFWLVQKRQA